MKGCNGQLCMYVCKWPQIKSKFIFSFSFALMCALSYVTLFPTNTTYTTITACSICISHNYLLFCLRRRSSNHDYFVHTQLHTRLTEFVLLTDRCPLSLALLYIYVRTLSLWWKFLKRNVHGFAFSRILLRFLIEVVNILTCLV